jgi:hypothetical protein
VRVQRGHVFDDVARPPRDVVVLRVRKPASTGDEVLEHHHVPVALGVGGREPDLRDPYRYLGRKVAVEARLGHAHPDGRDELALALVEGGQLHEHGRGNACITGQCDVGAAGGAGAPVDDRDRRHVSLQCGAEPLGREIGDVEGQHGREATHSY